MTEDRQTYICDKQAYDNTDILTQRHSDTETHVHIGTQSHRA